MPFDWTELRESLNKATEATQDWSNLAYQQGSDFLKSSGVEDLSIGDLWNMPFDLAAKLGTNPSAARYKECKDKQGESGWDERGVWGCLFPKATRPPTWYTNYSDFLEARDAQYRERQREVARYENPRLISAAEAQGKRVTRRDVNINTEVDAKGDAVTRRVVTTYYDDGTATKEDDQKGGRFWN